MTRTVVFDVNETLLDLSALDASFDRVFADASVRIAWFGLVLRTALTLTITGDYEDFVAVGRASLQMIGDARGVEITEADQTLVAAGMRSLPAHQDVDRNLDRLQSAGATLAALTNSPRDAAVAQLTNAGIIDRFHRVLSVDRTQQFKPAAAVYQSAANDLEVDIDAITMVAAHDWDIAGAMRAGTKGAFLARPGMVWNPLYPDPDITAPDLDQLVDELLVG